jgi:chemotaxis signal transduction protein
VRLYCPPTTDGAHALYAFLRLAAQRYGLEVGDVQEIREPPRLDD